LPASDTKIAGAPRIAMRNHGSAACAMSAEPAIADTSGTAAACTTTTISAPRPRPNQVACTPSATADARSSAPKWRAERAVVPYDRKVSCEPTMPRISPPMASPARLNAPSRPTTAVSNSK
jgi:crotonobetainyl-CoA:carnitine CoA-transferase CaiB-like acyl-CoA transferase